MCIRDSTWTTSGGVLKQTDKGMQGKLYVCDVQPGQNYTYEVEATKTGGAEDVYKRQDPR